MTTWILRKTGSDANGGTSKTVRSTNTDGATNVGNNNLTSASALFVAGDVGHGINIASNWRLITAFNSSTSISYSGAPIATASGRTWTIGGAFLTLGKVFGLNAAGDTIYLGAGTYREANTLTISGSAGNYINYIGDIDGVQTGDPGEINISNWLTSDSTAPTNSTLLTLSSRIYLAFQYLNFYNGGNIAQTVNSSAATDHLSFIGCHFYTARAITVAVSLNLKVDANSGVLFDRCTFVGPVSTQITLTLPTSTTADYDSGYIIRNCVFLSGTNAIGPTASGANSFKGGGGLVAQNTFFLTSIALAAGNVTTLSSSIPCRFVGNLAVYSTSFPVSAGSVFQQSPVVEDWNLMFATTLRNGVGVGPNSASVIMNAGHEFLNWLTSGRAPRPALQPAAGSPILGFVPVGTQLATGAPTTAVDDATVGTIAWTNPTNANYFDTNLATCVMTTGTTGHYLKLTGFGFALPSTATVTQIRVEYCAKSTVTNNVVANAIKLVKGGVIGGTDNVALLTNPTATLAVYSVGSAGDLWGQTWLYSDINAATFGVAISFKDTSGSSTTANIEFVRIIVNYIDSAVTPTEQTIDLSGAPRPAGGTSVAIAAGALERANVYTMDQSVYHGAAPSVRLDGSGYFDQEVPVDTTSTSVKIWGQYNGSYTGTLPTMEILNGTEAGVANASVAMVGAANIWEQISLTIAPTQAGIITVRFHNYSTAAAGSCYFDDFSAL